MAQEQPNAPRRMGEDGLELKSRLHSLANFSCSVFLPNSLDGQGGSITFAKHEENSRVVHGVTERFATLIFA